jgi:hypothetical protein
LCFSAARRRALFRLRFGFFDSFGIVVVYVRRLRLSNGRPLCIGSIAIQ